MWRQGLGDSAVTLRYLMSMMSLKLELFRGKIHREPAKPDQAEEAESHGAQGSVNRRQL